MNKIHIAYSTDDNFAELTCVSMCSVLRNTKYAVKFYVFETSLSELHKSKISKLVSEYTEAELSVIHINLDENTYISDTNRGVTKETYVKCLLPELLPDVSECIWLDGDTIADGDISELWNIDLDGNVFAAIEDMNCFTAKRFTILEIDEPGGYYNTGVMKMDLNALRKIGLSNLVRDKTEDIYNQIKKSNQLWWAEQDMMNYLLKGRIKEIPVKYNSFIWFVPIRRKPLIEYVEAMARPIVIHFVANKPNKISREYYYSGELDKYYYYKRFTPYYTQSDDERIKRYHEYENKLLHSLYVPETIGAVSYALRKRLFEIALTHLSNKDKQVVIWGYNGSTALFRIYLASNNIDVAAVVDGEHYWENLYACDKEVESPLKYLSHPGEYYMLLFMNNAKVAANIRSDLLKRGWSTEQIYHINAPLYEEI